MFIGHFGIGFAAKKFSSQLSLGTLFIATQFIDLLWPILILLGLEKVEIDIGNTVVTPLNFIAYPISHSLIGVVCWAGIVGIVYYLIKKDRAASITLGLVLLSHWVLDLITHRPDLEIISNIGSKVGFGLWNSLIGTMVVEVTIFALGIYYYLKTTRAINKKGDYALWGLITFIGIIYAGNLFSPPPPSVDSLPFVGLATWLLVAWGYWVDRNRESAT